MFSPETQNHKLQKTNKLSPSCIALPFGLQAEQEAKKQYPINHKYTITKGKGQDAGLVYGQR
jgi:hypothetical protein